MGWSLRIRWLWLGKFGASRPWAGLPIQVSQKETAFFHMAVETHVGNGENSLFWRDRWLEGGVHTGTWSQSFKNHSGRISKKRTVAQGLLDRKWVSDMRTALTVLVILEYLLLWDILYDFVLQPRIANKHRWRLDASGSYSSQSVYNAFFQWSIRFSPWKRT